MCKDLPDLADLLPAPADYAADKVIGYAHLVGLHIVYAPCSRVWVHDNVHWRLLGLLLLRDWLL
jgi:hypothetical protein